MRVGKSPGGRRDTGQPFGRIITKPIGPTARRLGQTQIRPHPVVIKVGHGIAGPRAVFRPQLISSGVSKTT